MISALLTVGEHPMLFYRQLEPRQRASLLARGKNLRGREAHAKSGRASSGKLNFHPTKDDFPSMVGAKGYPWRVGW